MSQHFEQVSNVTANNVTFTWKIQNFSTLYDIDRDVNFRKHSSTFRASSRSSYLTLYPNKIPNHRLSLPTSNYIAVKLESVDSDDQSWISRIEIGFKTKTNDCRVYYVEKVGDDISESTDWIRYAKGLSSFCITVEKDKLFRKEAELLPEDVLTIFCNIEYMVMTDEKLNEVKGNKSPYEEETLSKLGSATLSKNIETLIEKSHFSDVTLKVGEDAFQAHKNVLSCRSKVFEAMFESGMKEGLNNEVNVTEMKPSTAKEMLYYIYAGKIQELSMDRAMDLYVAADRYDLQELRGWCKDFILKHISADDVSKVAVMADLHNDEELKISAKKIFKRNSKTILLSDPWKNFATENLSVYVDLMESTLLS